MGAILGGLVAFIILISVLRHSSHFMARLLDYAPQVIFGALFAGIAVLIGVGLVKGVIKRMRGDGWIYAGARRDRFIATFAAVSVARGAAMIVTGVVRFFGSVMAEVLPLWMGAFILLLGFLVLMMLWDAGISSIWDLVIAQIMEHRAVYSELLIAIILGSALVMLSIVAGRRMRQ